MTPSLTSFQIMELPLPTLNCSFESLSSRPRMFSYTAHQKTTRHTAGPRGRRDAEHQLPQGHLLRNRRQVRTSASPRMCCARCWGYAKEHKPCVIFMDEMIAIGGHQVLGGYQPECGQRDSADVDKGKLFSLRRTPVTDSFLGPD